MRLYIQRLEIIYSLAAHRLGLMTLALALVLIFSSHVEAQYNTTVANGEVTITGYTDDLTSFVIPAKINGLPVTRIDDFAFADDYTVRSFTLPNTIKSIGLGAFMDCPGLTSIVIPNSVTSLEDQTFMNCTALRTVTIGKGVTVIPTFAFTGCSALTSVTIPNGVTTIEESAFDTTGLTSLTLPDSVTTIESGAFEFCQNLKSVTLGKGLQTIGDNVFIECVLVTQISLPDSLVSIGDHAFDTTGLTGITFGKNLTTIGLGAFAETPLKTVTIPDGVTYIGDAAFFECLQLTSVTLGKGLTSTGNGTFSENPKLRTVSMPANIVNIGDQAFQDDTNLTNVVLPKNLTSIGFAAFLMCPSMHQVNLPASLTTLGDNAFAWSGLTSITLTDNITNMGGVVFGGCDQLKSITFLSHPTSIGDSMFSGCSRLTQITIPDSVTTIGNGAFSGCGLTSLTIPNNVTAVGGGAFSYCDNLGSVTFGNSVATIGDSAFYGCDKLHSLVLPKTLTSVGDSAFWGVSFSTLTFKGDAPIVKEFAFSWSRPTVYYYDGAAGFTSPTWTTSGDGSYPAVDLGVLAAITSGTMASADYKMPFAGYTITATETPTQYSAVGLPAGLSINAATGVITGTPLQAGVFNVEVGATNTVGTGTTKLLVTVAQASASVTLGNLAAAYDGKTHAATVTTVPAGLAVATTYAGDAAAPSAVGSYAVVATIQDSNYTGSANGALVITPILPLATTTAASGVSATAATLNGTTNPKTSDTQISFQFGTSTAYGSSTVALDAGSDAVTFNFSTPISFPASNTTVVYHYRAVATNAAGTVFGADKTFTTVPQPSISIAPQVSLSATDNEINLTVNPDGAATSVSFQYGTTTAYDNVTAAQNLGSGKNPVSVFGLFPNLNPGTTYHYRVVMTGVAGTFYGPDETFTTLPFDTVLIAQKGDAAAGTGTTFMTFGNPAINVDDLVAFTSTLTPAASVTTANNIGLWTIDNTNTQHLIARIGNPAPATGGNFLTLADPVINDNGAVAFRATLKPLAGQVTTANATGIWSTSSGTLQLVARQGTPAPGTNGTFANFTALGLTQTKGVVFLGTLNPGTGITVANNTGIWEGNSAADLHLVVGSGQVFYGEKITKLSFMPKLAYVNGQTRSFTATGDIVCTASFVTNFGYKETGWVTVINGVVSLATADTDYSFSDPAFNNSDHMAQQETVKQGAPSNTLNLLIVGDNTGTEQVIAAVGSDLAPGTSALFASFNDMVYNNNNAVAFRATLKVGAGQATTTTATGVWCTGGNASGLSLIARQGSQAPGCPLGATFATFTELALPDQGGATNQGGVLLLATLNANTAAGVSASNNLGIWAVDNAGALQLIVRTGDILGGKTVTGLAFLPSVAVVGGQTRSFAQSNGDLVYLATFSDKSTAIFNVVF